MSTAGTKKDVHDGTDLRAINKRFDEKVKGVLKDDLNEYTYPLFIEPLRVIAVKGDIVTLFSEHPHWLAEHYAGMIKELLNAGTKKPVKIQFTNEG